MPSEITSLFELDTEVVQAKRAVLETLIVEMHPSLDTRRGAFSDLVLQPAAVLAAARQEEIDRYRRATSLNELNADPTLADNDDVDEVMSNFLITRREGTKAAGPVTIVVSQLATVTIVSGMLFVASGQQFRTLQAYAGRTSSQAVAATGDRVLTPLGDGTFAFTIDVEAVEEGAEGLLPKNTLLVPQSSIVNFVKAYAASDFTGGRTTETNAELAVRLQLGYAAKTVSNRINMTATLLADERFVDVVSNSIIGYGDAEMQRDKHSILPGAFGGRVDWYLRTQELPQRKGLTKTATLVTKHSDNRGTWEFQLSRDDLPGYYDVVSIVPTNLPNFAGSLAITSHERIADLTAIAGELTPDVISASEASFTRYQRAVIRFKDTETDVAALSLGATKDYAVTVRGMPLLADAQNAFGQRGQRFGSGDILIKGAVPCFTSVAFTLEGKAGAAIPDTAQLAVDIARTVNRLGFTGRLYAAQIADLIHSAIGGQSISAGAIHMLGQILRPDGTVRTLTSTSVLVVPNESSLMVSPRTVCFILDPADVRISVATVNIPQLT